MVTKLLMPNSAVTLSQITPSQKEMGDPKVTYASLCKFLLFLQVLWATWHSALVHQVRVQVIPARPCGVAMAYSTSVVSQRVPMWWVLFSWDVAKFSGSYGWRWWNRCFARVWWVTSKQDGAAGVSLMPVWWHLEHETTSPYDSGLKK